ncbi:caspase domain-containing protein, partial [Phormidesmis sp. 146-35]
MASNWAIVIGINQYRFLQPLKYAKRDAEAMQNFLMQEARFDRIFLFTDDSPSIGGKPTEPFRANLLRVLRQVFDKPFMKDGDNFWFFFSGHGIPHNGQDYLMPLDGDPEDIENTGISTNTITNYLRSCGADNAVMILDACRSGGKKSGEGIGRQTEAKARQTGVISLFSCSPDQYSYELEAIGQGAFTYALLEGLDLSENLQARLLLGLRSFHQDCSRTIASRVEAVSNRNHCSTSRGLN